MKWSRKRHNQWVAGIIDGCSQVLERLVPEGVGGMLAAELSDAADALGPHGLPPIDTAPYEAARLWIHARAGGMEVADEDAEALYRTVVGDGRAKVVVEQVPCSYVLQEPLMDPVVDRTCDNCLHEDGHDYCADCYNDDNIDRPNWAPKP